MTEKDLENYTKDELIAELINRSTFAGIVVFHRGDAKAGRLEPGEIVFTKSPPLARRGVEQLLEVGQSLVAQMFAEGAEGSAVSLPLSLGGPLLRLDEGGAIRIGTSRISLDLVVEQYENGQTPEEMVRTYDDLELSDAYAAIAYYLRHSDLVRAYLKARAEEAESLRIRIETERPRIGRDELLARRKSAEKDHAPAGQ